MANRSGMTSGGPVIPGAGPKPPGMDQPCQGTHPMLCEHPTKGLGKGAGRHGSGGGRVAHSHEISGIKKANLDALAVAAPDRPVDGGAGA